MVPMDSATNVPLHARRDIRQALHRAAAVIRCRPAEHPAAKHAANAWRRLAPADIRQASRRVPETTNWKPAVIPVARRAASAC